MHRQVRRTLAKLVQQYGDELIDDPRRTEALLNDLCGKYTREIFVLVNAQRRRVPVELRDAPGWIPISATVNRLARRLEEQLALTPDAALWAVESWALALGRIQEPVQSSHFTLLPFGIGRSNRAKQSGQSAPRKAKGQNETTVVQSTTGKKSEESGAKNKQAQRKQVTRGTSLWPRARAGHFPAWMRSRTSHTLIWATVWASVLFASLILVWAVLDGSVLSGGLISQLNDTEPAATQTATPVSGLSAETITELAGSGPTDSGVSAFMELYPLPQSATVTAEALRLRAGPTLEAETRSVLPAGQPVTVDAFSANGAWSRLSAPASGWVSTDFLAFNAGTGQRIQMQARTGQIQTGLGPVFVFTEPSTSAPLINQLSGGDPVEIVAATLDNSWVQVSSPFVGWIAASAVEFRP
jgi:hypothetical protein